MIAILVPEYLESSWCKAEWRAMETLELDRTTDSANGFIIPILFRGEEGRFADFCGIREYSDFRYVANPRSQLKTVRSRQQIEAIAQRIAELSEIGPHTDCSRFVIESDEEAITPGFDDPNPLR